MPAAIHENILNADHHNSGLVGFAQGGRLRQTLVHSLRSFQHGLLQFGGLRNLGETLCGGGGRIGESEMRANLRHSEAKIC